MIDAGVVRCTVVGLGNVGVVVRSQKAGRSRIRRRPQFPVFQCDWIELACRDDDTTGLVSEVPRVLLFKQGGREYLTCGDALNNSQSLHVDEEKGFILPDGPANRTAKLVLPVLRPGNTA